MQGDLTKCTDDAIVNTVGASPNLGNGPLFQSIIKAGGEVIEKSLVIQEITHDQV